MNGFLDYFGAPGCVRTAKVHIGIDFVAKAGQPNDSPAH